MSVANRQPEINAIVFDLGGVLIDWNPRYLYRKLIGDESAMEDFLKEVVSHEWNASFDAGRSFAEGVNELSIRYPEYKDLIAAYHLRWPEMLGGAIHGTVEILRSLAREKRYRLLGLSNWSAETFHFARQRFDFLELFETILVSGEEKLIKPDPKFYRLLNERLGVELAKSVFIDDVQKNIDAASGLGMKAIRFENPDRLRADLTELGVSI